jgi:uncharacterized oxidoreductase
MSPLLATRTTILLTGATSGIGKALQQRLAAEGHETITVSRTAAHHAQTGIGYSCDLSDPEAVVALCSELQGRHPDISVIINNAGVQHALKLIESTSDQIIEEAMLNLVAPALIAQSFLPTLLRRTGGSAIVNVSSGLAFFPKETTSLYCATKAALHSLTKSLRYACEGSDVLITEAILPLVATPMTEGRGRGKISADEAARAILAGLKGGRAEIWIGKARLIPVLQRVAPALGHALVRRG